MNRWRPDNVLFAAAEREADATYPHLIVDAFKAYIDSTHVDFASIVQLVPAAFVRAATELVILDENGIAIAGIETIGDQIDLEASAVGTVLF
jgi:hypothetical protein